MRYFLTTLAIFVMIISVSGQTFTRRLIFSDTRDSLFIKGHIRFDDSGHFCCRPYEKGDGRFITDKDTIGPFRSIVSTFGSDGSFCSTSSYSDTSVEPWYYMNYNSPHIWGPVTGKRAAYNTNNTRNSIALITLNADTAYYYINGRMVSSAYIEKQKQHHLENEEWCALSENGNCIYSIQKNGVYSLFINDKLIDTAFEKYYELQINDSGKYFYAKGQKSVKEQNDYDYAFYIYNGTSKIGPVRTVWHHALNRDGTYYYSGNDNSTDYILVNGDLYKGIKEISNITINKRAYLFTFREKNLSKINVTGKVYDQNYDNILLPTVDEKGNSAFIARKNYYLYKVINGQESKQPITRYNVRPTPIYISPSGVSTHIFKTDDSTYVYRDDTMLFRPLPNKNKVSCQDHSDLFPASYVKGKVNNGQCLKYLELDTAGYWIYNGEFSKPLPKAINSSGWGEKTIGQIIDGQLTDWGFYFIQKTSENTFLININNSIYKELTDIDEILKDNTFFNKDQLIFYGTKGYDFFQFKLAI